MRAPKVLELVVTGVMLVSATEAHAQVNQREWTTYQPQLSVQLGLGDSNVESFSFSSDGTKLITSGEQWAVLWDVETGAEIGRYGGWVGGEVDYVPGPYLATLLSSEMSHLFGDETAELALVFDAAGGVYSWNVDEGSEEGDLGTADPGGGPTWVGASADGRYLAVTSWLGDEVNVLTSTGPSDDALLWDGAAITSGAISQDGRLLVTGGGQTVILWDLETREEIKRYSLRGDSDTEVVDVSLSPDGAWVFVTASDGVSSAVWDVRTGTSEPLAIDAAAVGELKSGTFSPVAGNRLLALGGLDRTVLFDLDTGGIVQTLLGGGPSGFSPDGRFVFTAGEDATGESVARLWSLESGEHVRSFEGQAEPVGSVAFSADGMLLYTEGPQASFVWDLSTGRESVETGETARGEPGEPLCSDAYPDPEAWDFNRMRALSPDCSKEAVFDSQPQIVLRDMQTGEETAISYDDFNSGGMGDISALVFSPSGRYVLSAWWDGSIRIWDPTDPEGGITLQGQLREGSVRRRKDQRLDPREPPAIAFSPDETHLAAALKDGTLGLWSLSTGQLLARLISFRNGDWAVVDPQGRYDASNAGDIPGMHWIIGGEHAALSQLKERYYDPGLLSKHVGMSNDVLLRVESLNERGIPLFPSARVATGGDVDPKFSVSLHDRDGGIGRVSIFVNDKEFIRDARDVSEEQKRSLLDILVFRGEEVVDAEDLAAWAQADSVSLNLDLSSPTLTRYLWPDAENRIDVLVMNGDGTLASRRIGATHRHVDASDPNSLAASRDLPANAGGEAMPILSCGTRQPALWAVIAGIQNYQGGAIDLQFSGKDAIDFAVALASGARALFSEQVHIKLLADGADARASDLAPLAPAVTDAGEPNKENLRAAFEAIAAEAHACDVLVVYFAGHGINFGNQYYYLTNQASGLSALSDPAIARQRTVSASELTDWINRIPAQKQALIFDTCASGSLADQMSGARAIPASHTRAMERMKDRTGTFLLAGSAPDARSYESSQFGQGLLTYSLLEGMKGPALSVEGGVLDVVRWFSYASDRVSQLALDLTVLDPNTSQRTTVQQQPHMAQPFGGGSQFYLGAFTPDQREAISLASGRPVIVRPTFQDEEDFVDYLGMNAAVRTALVDQSSVGDAPWLYLDTVDYPDAFQVLGRYSAYPGGTIEVKWRVFFNGQDVGTAGSIVTEGSRDDLSGLAARLTQQLVDIVVQDGRR